MSALSGARPQRDSATLVHRLITAEPDLDGVTHPGLRRLIVGCLAKDPAARPTPAQVVALYAGTVSVRPGGFGTGSLEAGSGPGSGPGPADWAQPETTEPPASVPDAAAPAPTGGGRVAAVTRRTLFVGGFSRPGRRPGTC